MTERITVVPANEASCEGLQPGQDISWGELHVGSRSVFAAAGFAEVSHPRST